MCLQMSWDTTQVYSLSDSIREKKKNVAACLRKVITPPRTRSELSAQLNGRAASKGWAIQPRNWQGESQRARLPLAQTPSNPSEGVQRGQQGRGADPRSRSPCYTVHKRKPPLGEAANGNTHFFRRLAFCFDSKPSSWIHMQKGGRGDSQKKE